MSRSHKKTPITGYTSARSCTPYKRIRAGEERARLRQALHHDWDTLDTELAPWNEWASDRDGKYYISPQLPKCLDGLHSQEWWDEYRRKLLRK